MTRSPWTLTVAPPWAGVVTGVRQALDLVCRLDAPVHEHERGAVFETRVGDATLVVKRSKSQERRLWFQVISVWRGGEGNLAFRNLCRMREAGLPVAEPVFALERRVAGVVVSSWHAYRRLDGDACTCVDAPQVARALERLHDRGWVHRDSHVKNFLKHGNGTSIIDTARAKPWRSAYARHYDLVLLNKCCPGARLFYPGFVEGRLLYRLAQRHNDWIVGWRRAKRTVRQALGIGRQAGDARRERGGDPG